MKATLERLSWKWLSVLKQLREGNIHIFCFAVIHIRSLFCVEFTVSVRCGNLSLFFPSLSTKHRLVTFFDQIHCCTTFCIGALSLSFSLSLIISVHQSRSISQTKNPLDFFFVELLYVFVCFSALSLVSVLSSTIPSHRHFRVALCCIRGMRIISQLHILTNFFCSSFGWVLFSQGTTWRSQWSSIQSYRLISFEFRLVSFCVCVSLIQSIFANVHHFIHSLRFYCEISLFVSRHAYSTYMLYNVHSSKTVRVSFNEFCNDERHWRFYRLFDRENERIALTCIIIYLYVWRCNRSWIFVLCVFALVYCYWLSLLQPNNGSKYNIPFWNTILYWILSLSNNLRCTELKLFSYKRNFFCKTWTNINFSFITDFFLTNQQKNRN